MIPPFITPVSQVASPAWQRFRRLLADEPLPAALVDLDALETNLDRMLAAVRAAGRRLRLATKSIRCPALIDRLAHRCGDTLSGLMTYTAGESAFLASQGHRDLLLAYPTARSADARLLAAASQGGAVCSVVVDDRDQIDLLDDAAGAAGTCIPAVLELDLGYRPLGGGPHLGVRRSPLRTVEEIVELAGQIAGRRHLRFQGLMGYEAHIAGLSDHPAQAAMGVARRLLKRLSVPEVARSRARAVEALRAAGLAPELVNGGGTGSLQSSLAEPVLTEVTVGSGCLASHLFDGYDGLALEPALFFALQVVRRPGPGLVTCHGGGLIASGQPGPDRLPRPVLPPGLELLPMEGAGEVQTPLQLPSGVKLALGDPVIFRPAKAGEPAEHFNHYLLVRGDRIEERVPTYRGLGHCFLG